MTDVKRELTDAEIEELGSQEAERRWIPVSERLPEHMQRVIVSNGRSVGEAKYFYFAGVGFRHGWYQIDGMALGASYATHWMPLPEPPIMYGKESEE